MRAVVCAVPSAAGRQDCVGVGREGQQRRDQRKAEEEKQGDAEKRVAQCDCNQLRRWMCQGSVIRPAGDVNWGFPIADIPGEPLEQVPAGRRF